MVDNKVKWCLSKAQRELEESEFHRGLVKVDPNIEKARNHLVKAQHNLNAAQFFHDHGYSDWSANAFFYCIYHCFLGIIRKYGYESRNQECTLACIRMLLEQKVITFEEKYINLLEIAKSKEIDFSVIEVREEYQYGTDTMFKDKQQFALLNKTCKLVLEEAKNVVS